MKSVFKYFVIMTLVLGAVGGIAFGGYTYVQRRNKPQWRTAEVVTGDIVAVVNATGIVKPTKSVEVGSFVSGPLEGIFVKSNQPVKKGDLMAKIDPRLFQAGVDRDKASLKTREADVKRAEAQLQQAINDEKRAELLRQDNPDFISQSEMDKFHFATLGLKAQLQLSEASVEQARAQLKNTQDTLDYTDIMAPEDGIIIERKVEPGQTLASQFQTPVLFVVGVGLREKMHVFADVVEADIGLIREAQLAKLPVSFTVYAYPDDLFQGEIEEVRYNSTTTQTVVTYPVVIGTPNPDLKLLPGMTANISFQSEKRANAIRIPNAALRFYPDKKYVHPDDHAILDGTKPKPPDELEDEQDSQKQSAEQRSQAAKNRRKRHVWKLEGELLRAVEVTTGISDREFTELVAGDLTSGTSLVIGLDTTKPN
jgi:HlyD family secretion protein